MRTKFVVLLTATLFVAFTASASLAGVWQLPLDRAWNIDPEFAFGTPYGGEVHLGEDVEAPAGTEVRAAANGVVKVTANYPGYHDWGGLILIEHKNVTGSSVVSLYGHIDARTFAVRPGQIVNRGHVIGRLGDPAHNGHWKTHLHFAIREGGYISSPWVYWGFAARSVLSRWEPAHTYVPARADLTDVGRLPLASRNRYATAAAVSSWEFPIAASVNGAFVVSGEQFPDALATTVLAHERGLPVLLARSGGVPDETMRELERVLAAGSTVYLVGGTDVLGPAVETQLQSRGWTIERIAGPTAPATAVAVAQELDASGQGAYGVPDTAFIVSSRSFADGLSAAAPGATQHAPVLLTDPSIADLSPETKAYLAQTPALQNIVIVGGLAAVSQAAEDALAALPQNPTVSRVAGYDRYATNRFVNERYFNQPQYLITATGEKFADALVGAHLAARTSGALLLASYRDLQAQVSDYVAAVRPSVQLGLVLGGKAALSESVDLRLGGILNAGFAGAAVSQPVHVHELPPVDWTAASVVATMGLELPIPGGFAAEQTRINGYQSVRVTSAGKDNEPEALLATRLPYSSDHAHQIAQWLGVDETTIASDSVHADRYSITRGFAPRLVQVVARGSELLIFAVLQTDSVEQTHALLDRLVELN